MVAYPKISIVTPSYNQGGYIEQTILSIVNQNYPNLEYIIIDGGSTDNTLDVIKKYSDKITYWISEPDNGQSDAINKGLEKCTGEIFNWINSDDYLEDNALWFIGLTFANHPEIDQLCGWCSFFGASRQSNVSRHRSELFDCTEKTLVEQRLNQPASFWRLPVLRTLGKLNVSLNCVMDLELWFRYQCRYGQEKIRLTDKVLAHFRIHEQSKTQQFEFAFRAEETAMWMHLLRQVNAPTSFMKYFKGKKNTCFNNWSLQAINKDKLLNFLSEKHLFGFVKEKNFAAARFAFWRLLRENKIPLNTLYLKLCLRLYSPFQFKNA